MDPNYNDASYMTPEFSTFLSSLRPAVENAIEKSFKPGKVQSQDADYVNYAAFWGGVKEPARTSNAITFETLRAMAATCPPISAIITTRCNQVAAFCQLPESDTDVGFRICPRDPEHKPSKEERDEIRRIEDMILECAFVEDSAYSDITFDHFVRAIVRDSLELDACCFEIVPGMNPVKYPVAALVPVDAAQIRFVHRDSYRPVRRASDIYAVQMQQGRAVAEYTNNELAYGIRNPTTNVYRMGYGTSELEWLIRIVTCILFGIDYNQQYFTNSSVPPGLLSITGKYDPKVLEAFRQEWTSLMSGSASHWKTPVMATADGSGINYIKFRDTNRDMEYHQFLAFMITVACSCYNIHPEEIGMQSWAPQTAALSQPSPLSRIEASTDRGLKPVMKMLSNLLNKKVLWRMFPDRKYMFKWVNIDGTDEERDLKLAQMRLEMGLTLPADEQTKFNLDEHDYSHVPLNSQMFQAWQADNQRGQDTQLDANNSGAVDDSPAPDTDEIDTPAGADVRDPESVEKSFKTLEVTIHHE